MSLRSIERGVVSLVAAHSIIVGIVLLAVPEWAAEFGGWGRSVSPFFVRQGGAFHLVVGVGYLMEYFRHGTVRLLVTAKTVATIFLGMTWINDPAGAWAVLPAGIGDALMGLVTFLLHRSVRRTA